MLFVCNKWVEVFFKMYIIALCVDVAITTHFRRSCCNICVCTSLQLPAAGHVDWMWPTIDTHCWTHQPHRISAGLLSVRVTLSDSELLQPSTDALTVILLCICLTSSPESLMFYKFIWVTTGSSGVPAGPCSGGCYRLAGVIQWKPTSEKKWYGKVGIYRKTHQDEHETQ